MPHPPARGCHHASLVCTLWHPLVPPCFGQPLIMMMNACPTAGRLHILPMAQPMDLRHYPFDSWELLVTLEFLDTSLKASGHPGLSVELSSGGAQLYSCAHAAAAAAAAPLLPLPPCCRCPPAGAADASATATAGAAACHALLPADASCFATASKHATSWPAP